MRKPERDGLRVVHAMHVISHRKNELMVPAAAGGSKADGAAG